MRPGWVGGQLQLPQGKNKDHDGRFNGIAQNKSERTEIFVIERYVSCTLPLRSAVKNTNITEDHD